MMVYLAGAIEYAPDNGEAWRAEISQFITQQLGHEVFNPCVEENHILTPEEFRNFRKWKKTDLTRFRQTVRKLIHTDLDTLLHKVDYIVCYWDQYARHGAGTHGELTMAYYHNIPVYMVTPLPLDEVSSWIIGCTTELFTNFQDLKQFLVKKFQPGGNRYSDLSGE